MTRPAARDDDVLAGEHALYEDGDLRTGRKCFDAAYHEAERRGDPPGMARAALGLGGLWLHEHRTAADAAMVRVRQRDALALIDPRSPLALRLRIRLAAEDDYRTGGHQAILALAATARRAGDPLALAEALSLAHHCVLGPEHGALRLELAQELIGVASRTGRRGDLLMGLLWRTVDLFLAADPHAERALAELRALLIRDDHLAVRFVVSAIDVMLGIRQGRFEDAEALAVACADDGAVAGDIDATGWFGGQVATIRWYQGRIAELVPALSELVNSPTLSAVDHSSLAGLAVAAATAGDRRLATGALARLRGRDLSELPRSSSWLTSMYAVVEAACLLHDAETATQAYALLTPFAHRPMISSLGILCLGSAHHSLGLAAFTMGDLDRAVNHLEHAVHGNLALGHWPAVALSRTRLGQALALRDGPRHAATRREQALARQEATALGMKPVGDAPPGLVTCRPSGRRWCVEMGGRTVLVANSVGMRHLATLLANPGYEVPAADLATGTGQSPEAAASAQPLLDDVARREYKQRLTQLHEEIDELESMNDLERAAALRAERDWLVAELAAAAGMSGRSREFAHGQERARISVGKAIRRALTHITEADPIIGNELDATIQTGTRCSYHPT